MSRHFSRILKISGGVSLYKFTSPLDSGISPTFEKPPLDKQIIGIQKFFKMHKDAENIFSSLFMSFLKIFHIS